MHRLLLSVCLIVLASCASAQSGVPTKNYVAVDPSDSSRYLYGPCDKSALLEGEFAEWTKPGYTAYKPDGSDCLELLGRTRWSGVKVEVFFATWCGDSKYQVPRFLRMTELAQMPDSCLSLIALDGDKCGPCGEEQNRQIHRVPTFIVSRNGVELGRIVEWTDRSLAEDFWRILSRYRYDPHYAVANALMKTIETEGPEAVSRRARAAAEAARPRLKNVAELAVVTHIYFQRKQYAAAEAVARVNAMSFEQSATSHYWLGRVTEQKGQLRQALRHYTRALSLDPAYSRALERQRALSAARG